MFLCSEMIEQHRDRFVLPHSVPHTIWKVIFSGRCVHHASTVADALSSPLLRDAEVGDPGALESRSRDEGDPLSGRVLHLRAEGPARTRRRRRTNQSLA